MSNSANDIRKVAKYKIVQKFTIQTPGRTKTSVISTTNSKFCSLICIHCFNSYTTSKIATVISKVCTVMSILIDTVTYVKVLIFQIFSLSSVNKGK